MGSVEPYETRSGRRYRVRYRDPDRRSIERAGFRTKDEAQTYLAEKTVEIKRGEYVDPRTAVVTVGSLGPEWIAGQSHLKPSSLRPLEIAWRIHVEPKWGARRVGDIRHSQVQAWVTALALKKGATTVLRAHGVLAGILDVATRDRRISSNPARGVNLPRKTRKPRHYLTVEQIEAVAEAAGERRALVLLLAYTGLRWGEATALRVRHFDWGRRRLLVEENAVRVGTAIVVGTPKSHSARTVPVPRFLVDELAQLCEGKARDHLLFGDGISHVRAVYGRNPWIDVAVRAAQAVDPGIPRVTVHDLRHTAASLAVSAGANVKAVQRMLGHASASMTLDTYADLFDDDLDAVSGALDDLRARRVVGLLWGEGSAGQV
ncbi:tyrosine-type recombinase/integrase [Pseudolysinimonas sp.]